MKVEVVGYTCLHAGDQVLTDASSANQQRSTASLQRCRSVTHRVIAGGVRGGRTREIAAWPPALIVGLARVNQALT